MPWTLTAQTNQLVRLYFNGGIFVYRRSTGFAKNYLDICLQLLDSGIGTKAEGYNAGIKEMSAIGFAVRKMGLAWRALPYSHDYVMLSKTHDDWYREELLKEARIIHYHDSMWPPFSPTFIECLHNTHPEVEKWLSSLGPMSNQAPFQWRLMGAVLKKFRARTENTYNPNCLHV